MRPGPRQLSGNVVAGMVVAGVRVLAVGDRRRVAARDARHRGEQPRHVRLGGVDARAGPDRAGHGAAVAAADLVPVAAHLVAGVAEEPHEVGMGAKTAVPDPDPVLGSQPGGHQRVRDAFHVDICDL